MKDDSSAVATSDQISERSRDVAWYHPQLTEVPPAAREILEQYSKIPASEIEKHVFDIREKAWDIWPYPCIGGFRFLELHLPTTTQYPQILDRIKSGERLLDLGCCFGQEIRRLIFDGAPSERLYGLDLRKDFFDLGYELFLDRNTCQSTFLAANIFEPDSEVEKTLDGKVSIIYAGAFFHLFDRPQQLQIAKRMATLLSSKPGSMVLGRHVGNVKAGRYDHVTNEGGHMFRHDEQSWKDLWAEAGRETGTEWSVWVELQVTARYVKSGGHVAEGSRAMQFCVTRM